MKTEIDIPNWNRREHYWFFKDFEEPFVGINVNIDYSRVYETSRACGYSFFLYYLHKSLVAANALEPFKYRIEEDKVFLYDVVHTSTTILRPDNTFGFADIEFELSYDEFQENAKHMIKIVKNESGLRSGQYGEATIHYSATPWLHFTALTHARKYSRKDSCPKITFGKIEEINRHKIMPISIFAHHGLIDGFHIGEYVDLFQKLLNE